MGFVAGAGWRTSREESLRSSTEHPGTRRDSCSSAPAAKRGYVVCGHASWQSLAEAGSRKALWSCQIQPRLVHLEANPGTKPHHASDTDTYGKSPVSANLKAKGYHTGSRCYKKMGLQLQRLLAWLHSRGRPQATPECAPKPTPQVAEAAPEAQEC